MMFGQPRRMNSDRRSGSLTYAARAGETANVRSRSRETDDDWICAVLQDARQMIMYDTICGKGTSISAIERRRHPDEPCMSSLEMPLQKLFVKRTDEPNRGSIFASCCLQERYHLALYVGGCAFGLLP